MQRLSNFFRPRDPLARSPQPPPALICRPVLRPEIEPSLRLILGDESGPASDETILEFLALAVQRNIDVNQIWIATVAGAAPPAGTILWALLPVVSPGRTMLLFSPSQLPGTILDHPPQMVIGMLCDAVCQHWGARGVHLAQLLIDPQHTQLRDAYVACGFEVLAELLYLSRRPAESSLPPPISLPQEMELLNYCPARHGLFVSAIIGSYQQSLDCPGLNGRREIEDVLAGHRATGQFDPSLWYVLTERSQPRGVLILSPTPYSDSLELVYLGLTPEARGRGLGAMLLGLALWQVHRTGKRELSLAVDSRNVPALKLYYRHGLKRIASRTALVRDLRTQRKDPATSAAVR
ncbi:GNAT family N-acetyltransferase [Fontivita pretiosa]|uniref:GNAT family N-acetyltransferase n=1 Tax=Fontivita pretiosa TaxID=2989684 RepID=UPI003D180C51